MFSPITTDRLLVRPMKPEDAESLWRRRNDPRAAQYQTWSTPYPRGEADRIVREVIAEEEQDFHPDQGERLYAVALAESDESIGDLYAEFSWKGRSVEIGYTFHPDHWGRGYAWEAVDAFVDYLFDTLGVTRVFGTLHPDNRPSAQVLERVGMLHEGHTRASSWLGDEVSDDWIYGMTRSDRRAWRERPRHRPDSVGLVEITGDMYQDVATLQTHKTQESFVAPVLKSLAQALLAPQDPDEPVIPWYRAIEADDRIVGFVMVALERTEDPEPFLWRLLIDRMHQRRGIATMALEIVEAQMGAMGHEAVKTSWIPGRGSPGPFYLARGYEETGVFHGVEVEGRKELPKRG